MLILGAPGTGKTQLFRALAGLWPWGAGRITRPRGEQIFYLPRGTPYMPRGTLREVLAYPSKAETFGARSRAPSTGSGSSGSRRCSMTTTAGTGS